MFFRVNHLVTLVLSSPLLTSQYQDNEVTYKEGRIFIIISLNKIYCQDK